jgi:hypothetical protein
MKSILVLGQVLPISTWVLSGVATDRRSLVLGLDTLTDVASGNIKGYLSLHAMPPKLLFQVLVHFGASGVNRIGSIMGLLQDELLQLFDTWDA